MGIKFNRSQTFATNGTVTSQGLHNLVDGLNVYQALITDQTLLTSVATDDEIMIADASLTDADAPRSTTVLNLFDDALTGGTYTNASFTGVLSAGTTTSNRSISTGAQITNGTIPNLTAGTTTSTLGTITNLSSGTSNSTSMIATSGTIGTLNSTIASITGGTFGGSLTSTTGTIATLNSTTGTIGNFSTTLAGDFTISRGTGTLGTSGVTSGTYGNATAYPIVTLDTKGRVTTISTSAAGGSVGTNSVYFDALSSSTSESTNVSKRVAKGWVNFDGVNDVIRSSFNVISVTHSTQGVYVINFNTTIGTGMGFSASGNRNDTYGYIIASDVSSATSLKIQASDNTATKQNINYVSATVFGL